MSVGSSSRSMGQRKGIGERIRGRQRRGSREEKRVGKWAKAAKKVNGEGNQGNVHGIEFGDDSFTVVEVSRTVELRTDTLCMGL